MCATNTKAFPKGNMTIIGLPYFSQNFDYGEHQSALSSVADFVNVFYYTTLHISSVSLNGRNSKSLNSVSEEKNPRCAQTHILCPVFSDFYDQKLRF